MSGGARSDVTRSPDLCVLTLTRATVLPRPSKPVGSSLTTSMTYSTTLDGDTATNFVFRGHTHNPKTAPVIVWDSVRKRYRPGREDREVRRRKSVRKRFTYSEMNPYIMNYMKGTSVPAVRASWRKNSFLSDTQILNTPPIHYWGVDIPQQNPIGVGFSFDPYEVPEAAITSDIAMIKLFSQVRKAKESGFDASLFLGEIGQTLSMFCDTAARISRSYRLLRRGKLREGLLALESSYSFGKYKSPTGSGKLEYGLKTNLVLNPKAVKGRDGLSLSAPIMSARKADVKEWSRWTGEVKRTPREQRLLRVQERFAQDHLAWTYGVQPLLDDLDQAAKKLAGLLTQKPPLVRVGGKHRFDNETDPVTIRSEIPGVQVSTVMRTKVSVKVKHVLWYSVQDEMVAHAESLGMLNPLSTAWQLSPTTFVFDWMFNLGGWLRNLSAFLGLQFHSGCTSRSGDITRTYHYGGMMRQGIASYSFYDSGVLYSLNYLNFWESTSGSTLSLKTGGFRRDLWASFPDVPVPRLRLPATVENAFSKLTSSLEMLQQRRSLVNSDPLPRIYRDIPVSRRW